MKTKKSFMTASRFQIRTVFRVDRRSAAQESPIDIGAKFFAADGSRCNALYGWAALGRYRSGIVLPLRHQRGRHTDSGSHFNNGVAAGKVLAKFHADTIAGAIGDSKCELTDSTR